ncbi:response regulator [Methylocystis sp. L43]|jgi:signal transduction histidine kinase/CheY-like chemotaxis protein|uniref:ATP-binding protein n=1 Tax=unclassified Methylocystis TaxID=2625913 RepID=UPI0018C26A88|nr:MULTISPECIES: ATP-binding protein [unclassified Methylocystis]MBG0799779.1 response regulator [Methylocystis sp. L43]MBG0807562.1 response regulator [Methylocystis sp. H15]
MSLNHIVILAAAQLVILMLAASIYIALRGRGREKVEAELESLRDEIWELRAAAAARDRAEAASLAKSRFLAAVSHEFRTPLNGVMGLAQLLAMTKLTAEQASYVEAIGDSSRSLSQLIDDILDFSKIEAGKFELRHEAFALAPFVESVVELLAPRAMAKGLELASVISPDTPREIVGDPARLRQVLVNLIGNAVKFTERGGVGVRVAREGARLRFEVRDSGPGVPEAAREAIFEEFEQADPSENHPQAGTGLGLAISRRLVARMGGALALVNSTDRGAVFAFTLPAPPFSEDRAAAPLFGLKTLIVAHSIFEAPYLAESLRFAGAEAEIVAAENAPSALQGPRQKPFDAVIVDCALGPHMTAQLAKVARDAQAGRLFLLFSPIERRAFGEDALCDFDGWLVKPVRIASLIARLSPESANAPAPADDAPPQALAGVNALIAEDNEINALILTRHLAKLGAKVTRAESGALALARAREAIEGAGAPYDVIVMDLFMPDFDGREASLRIREAEARAGAPRTPILVLTASAREEDERAARAAGVDAFLTKPVEFASLAATIEELRLAPRRRSASS